MTTLVILIIVLVVLGIFFIRVYNQLIAMIEAVYNNEKQIDIQLDRRYKVFQSLINVVKKCMSYEKTTLKEVVSLRGQAQEALKEGDQTKRMVAEDAISSIVGGLQLVFEQYPDLKAPANALQLQEEIVNTENKLAYAKQAFNDSIETYNATKKSFLQAILVRFCSNLDKNFIYWQLSKEAIKNKEDYTIDW